ncbi:MAG: histidinol-phosphatase [Clostridia bacterium]|nr:histidinol-phosphatase [Clostridia bacterium]
MKRNYHTHTFRCGHASGTEREYIEKAIAEGLEVLGFSDHVPMVLPDGRESGFRCPTRLLPDYIKTLSELREEYKGRIQILIGFEAEYYPECFERMLKMLSEYDYDYLIMGQHFVNNEVGEVYNSHPFTDEAKLKRYVDQVLEGARTGKFSYVAHPDVIGYFGEPEIYDLYMRRLCTELKALGIPVEFNLLGFEEKRIYPSERFFKIVAEVGNEVIVGCDAHGVAKVADKDILRAAYAELAGYGITPITELKLRSPYPDKGE